MKKLWVLCVLLACTVSSAHAALNTDGLLRRIWRAYQQTPFQLARRAQYQWTKFLTRQEPTEHLVLVSQNLARHILDQLKQKRKLEKLVPVGSKTAYLLRLARNLEPLPKDMSLEEKVALMHQAEEAEKQVQTHLLSRYHRLQNCLNNHPQLKIFALNPQASIFFAPERFFAPNGTQTAYQTAEQLFCYPDKFQKSFSQRKATGELTDHSFSLRIPAARNPGRQLEFFFSEEQHLIYFQIIKK